MDEDVRAIGRRFRCLLFGFHEESTWGVLAAEGGEVDAGDGAVALWEFVEEGRRIGLRVLIAPKDAWIGKPRE